MSLIKKGNNSRGISRRDFLNMGSTASMGLWIAGNTKWLQNFAKPTSQYFGVQIGVITYSYRSMPGGIDQTLRYITDSGINAIELMGDVIEDYAGKPANPVKMPPRVPGQQPQLTDEQKAQIAIYEKQVAEWRSSVSMDKFQEARTKFNNAGITIYAFKPNALGIKNTDAEIEYALRAAKIIGATSVTVELPTDPAQSKRLGEFGAKHKIYIGYHAHTQATDVAWDTALDQSPYNSMNLDCGHYIAAGGNNTRESLLALIKQRHDRITTLHLKDRQNKEKGGANMPWGQGDTPIREILTILKEGKYKIPATIELEYEIPSGSNAVIETKNCLEFARKALGA